MALDAAMFRSDERLDEVEINGGQPGEPAKPSATVLQLVRNE